MILCRQFVKEINSRVKIWSNFEISLVYTQFFSVFWRTMLLVDHQWKNWTSKICAWFLTHNMILWESFQVRELSIRYERLVDMGLVCRAEKLAWPNCQTLMTGKATVIRVNLSHKFKSRGINCGTFVLMAYWVFIAPDSMKLQWIHTSRVWIVKK